MNTLIGRDFFYVQIQFKKKQANIKCLLSLNQIQLQK